MCTSTALLSTSWPQLYRCCSSCSRDSTRPALSISACSRSNSRADRATGRTGLPHGSRAAGSSTTSCARQALLRLAVGAAHQRAQPRRQFVQVDRLDHVVVGADVEPADAVGHRVARGQHQHRQRHAGAAHGCQHVHAVLQRQAQVEHRRGIAARRAIRARRPRRRAPSRPGSRAGAGRRAGRHRAGGRLRRAGCAWQSIVFSAADASIVIAILVARPMPARRPGRQRRRPPARSATAATRSPAPLPASAPRRCARRCGWRLAAVPPCAR